MPLRKSQVRPSASKPDQIEGPERSASPAKIPAGMGRLWIHIAHANRRQVTARIVPFDWRERATRPGSKTMRKARMSAGRGSSFSRKNQGRKTSALPASAGMKRAMKFVLSMTRKRILVRRM